VRAGRHGDIKELADASRHLADGDVGVPVEAIPDEIHEAVRDLVRARMGGSAAETILQPRAFGKCRKRCGKNGQSRWNVEQGSFFRVRGVTVAHSSCVILKVPK
jgi:hypothetical protein